MEKEFLINKDDFNKHFNYKRVITKDELENYYVEKNVKYFNAVFNATSK